MPNPWWEWADNLAEQVENLEEENEMLCQKVECLESNVDFFEEKVKQRTYVVGTHAATRIHQQY